MTLHWATLREPPCQMNLAKPVAETDPLSNVVIVLNKPKDVVNIAGVIRVMMNMGLSRLRLVEPDEFDIRRIDGVAHRSSRIVKGTEFYESLAAAVSDVIYVVGPWGQNRTLADRRTGPRTIGAAIEDESDLSSENLSRVIDTCCVIHGERVANRRGNELVSPSKH